MDTLPALPGEEYVSGLTIKQEKFCQMVVLTGKAGPSYKAAGYKVKTAAGAMVNASRLMKNAKVEVFIKYLRRQAIDKTIADLIEIEQGLTEMFRGKITDFIETDEKGIARVKLNTKSLNSRAIQEVVTETIIVNDSPVKTQISKLKLRDPVPPAVLLSKLKGWCSDGANVYIDNRKIEINQISDADLERIAAGGSARALKQAQGTP